MKELIKTIIADFHRNGIPKLKERDVEIPLDSGKIVTLIGPRRAGKTYRMYQLIGKIDDLKRVVYINFEDERLDIKAEEMNIIVESYLELYPDMKETEIYFFFDEIQEVKGWDKFVRRIYDSVSKKIFITGSTSKLLSKEIATSLRGRTISYEIYPASFKEYLRLKNIDYDAFSTKGKALLLSELRRYIVEGGFPETIGMDREVYDKTIRNYLEVMMYKDIAERHDIKSMVALKHFIKKLIANVSKEFSLNKVYNELKSENIKVSKDTVYSFIDYCEDAYLIMPLKNFSAKLSSQTIKKAYVIDNSFCSIMSYSLNQDIGRLMENLVFIELKRRGKELYYFKGQNECDFIIKEKEKIVAAVQVCYNLTKDNSEREINGLQEVKEKFKLNDMKIITFDQETKIGDIEVLPFFKFIAK